MRSLCLLCLAVLLLAACGAPMPVELAAGGIRSCVTLDDGHVQCWGGHLAQASVVKFQGEKVPTRVESLENATQVCAGGPYACARVRGGSVACWAPASLNGEAVIPSHASVVSGLSDVTRLACGNAGGCALTSAGVRCWDWADEVVGAIETVEGLQDVSALAVGGHHRCALLGDGSIWCWGENADGQLGVSSLDASSSAQPIHAEGIATVRAIAAGEDFTCALGADGKVRCFGSNEVGQLGSSGGSSPAPVEVEGLSDVVELAAGGRHACARTKGGQVFCWGRNLHGELGDGSDVDRKVPVAVPGLPEVEQLALGDQHTCVRAAEGQVLCSGNNLAGQLGTGGYDDALQPTPVDLSP